MLHEQSTGVGWGLVRWWVMSKVITEISSLCLFSLLRHFEFQENCLEGAGGSAHLTAHRGYF